MINQFRKHTYINILLLILFGSALCLGVFLHLPQNLTPIFFEAAIRNLMPPPEQPWLTPEANVITTLIFTLLQAVLLNTIVNRHNLLGKPSFLPALMYMSLASLILPFLVLSPMIICNFISIWLFQKLLHLYRSAEIKGIMFDIGLIIAIGSLIYFPFIVMMLLIWISLSIFRPFSWREWVIPLVGFSTVYFLLGTTYFLTDRMEAFYHIWKPFTNDLPTSIHIEIQDAIVLFPVILIIILFIIMLRQHIFKNVVHVRKTIIMLFYMLLIVVGSFYLNNTLDVNHFLLAVPPLSIYMAYYFSLAQKRWVYESIFVLLIAAIVYFQYT